MFFSISPECFWRFWSRRWVVTFLAVGGWGLAVNPLVFALICAAPPHLLPLLYLVPLSFSHLWTFSGLQLPPFCSSPSACPSLSVFEQFVNISFFYCSFSFSHYCRLWLKKKIVTVVLIASQDGKVITINRFVNAQKNSGHGRKIHYNLYWVLSMILKSY